MTTEIELLNAIAQIKDKETSGEILRLVRIGQKEERHEIRSKRRGKLLTVLGWALIPPAVVAGIVFGCLSIAWHYDNNYAGIGTSKVAKHGSEAMKEWYGIANMPPQLTEVSEEKTKLYGVPAWRVTYSTPSSKQWICAYVWQGERDAFWQVDTGAACTT